MTKCAYHSEVDAVTACAEETLLAKAQVGEFKPNRVIPAEGESG